MKKHSKFSIAVIFFALLFGTVWHMNEQDAQQQLQELIEQRKASVALIQKQNPTGYLFAPDSKAHQDLIFWGYDKHFKTVELEHEQGLWYLHQSWTEWPLKRNALSAYVNEHGELSLLSHFFGNEVLVHNQVLVKIGNTVYDSSFIPTYTKAVLPITAEEQKLAEINTYTAAKDQEIVRQIALATVQPVQVLIKGDKASVTFDLSSDDQQAIADCYKLAQRIQEG